MRRNERIDESRTDDGINNNTYELLFFDNNNLPREEYAEYENIKAWITIDIFTRLEQKKIFCMLLKLISKETLIDINNITYNDETGEYEYKHDDLVITFETISKHIVDKESIRELLSKKRYGHCHLMSVCLSQSIENSRVITGQCTLWNRRFLHSVVEYDHNGETYILDWTRNLKTTKNQYMNMTHFVEFTSINADEILDELELLS